MQSGMCNFQIHFNTLRLRQNGRHFGDDTFKHIFSNETVIISIKMSLKFVPKGPMSNIPALVQIMAWRLPMMVSLLAHICATLPQWVNDGFIVNFLWNCPQMNTTGPYWCSVNSGSGNGLMVPSCYLNQCWPNSMTLYHHQGTIS